MSWESGPLRRFGAAAKALLARWVVGTLVLGLAIRLAPGVSSDNWWDVPVAVAVLALLVTFAQPFQGLLAARLSWLGVLVVGPLGTALLLWLALTISPGITIDSFGSVIWLLLVYVVISTLVDWLILSGDDERFLDSMVRRSRARHRSVERTEKPGVLFVQLDGVPLPVMRWALGSGALPTVRRWIDEGTHELTGWRAAVPSTTPISQSGILHGSNADMPAFRWYEKPSGTLLVANRPADAAVMESRHSDGTGLLADDGASVSNLFSGDAAVQFLTMSGIGRERVRGLGSSASYVGFFSDPLGLARSVVLTVGEMVKELYQARRQRLRGVVPRVHRGGSYVLLRGVTNVLQRDLSVALVVDQMMAGRTSIYVDFVDYDEVAHHAGPTRPESLRCLEGLDGVLAGLERAAQQAPRPYRIVALSDHGQSQGETFLQRTGRRLEDVVRELTGGAPVTAATEPVEQWGGANAVLGDVQGSGGVTGSITRRATRDKGAGHDVALGATARPARKSRSAGERPAEEGPGTGPAATPRRAPDEVVVVGSGCLGAVWFAGIPGRLTLEDVEHRWPGLVAGLACTEGVAFVVGRSVLDGDVVVGPRGMRMLGSGRIEGEDPLAGFDPRLAADLARVSDYSNAPDLYVHGAYDPSTGEVAAFEELVGSHGGSGGWQDQGMLLHPADLAVDVEAINGAEELHAQLVRWLEATGHRQALAGPHGGAVNPAP
ncbi:MAG TPA: phage holin family protein [Jiangellales bacterium]|nr:phage holin family protein [Jiangellales bacterium]